MGCTLPLPARAFYEPNWETGKAVRWKISLSDDEPFAMAGLWRPWPDGAISFTMPTLNADSHPLMRRFHKPGDEKRGACFLVPTGSAGLAAQIPSRLAHFFASTLPNP